VVRSKSERTLRGSDLMKSHDFRCYFLRSRPCRQAALPRMEMALRSFVPLGKLIMSHIFFAEHRGPSEVRLLAAAFNQRPGSAMAACCRRLNIGSAGIHDRATELWRASELAGGKLPRRKAAASCRTPKVAVLTPCVQPPDLWVKLSLVRGTPRILRQGVRAGPTQALTVKACQAFTPSQEGIFMGGVEESNS